jgi:EpsI family protein
VRIPAELEGKRSTDLEVPAEEQKVAGMSHYVLRSFGPDSAPAFTVYVGYYDKQVQGKSIHSPKNCLPGAGWEILSATRTSFATGDASSGRFNRVLLANKNARALVYYWYQGRGRREASEYVVKWNLLRDAALYGRTEESLVRLVFPLNATAAGDTRADEARVDDIAKRLLPTVAMEVDKIMPVTPGAD